MKLSILGTRGIPASHGGFETLAEQLAIYLTDQGWQVTVYCQLEGKRATTESDWKGVRLVKISVPGNNPLSTIRFDWLATVHAARERAFTLTLGYNTAIFGVVQWLRKTPNVINMDGIEWKRQKWSGPVRSWFRLNEKIGARIATHLIADHPGIADHLANLHGAKTRQKLTVIPYGAVEPANNAVELLQEYGLVARNYLLIIARPEPENSLLEMVEAYSSKPFDMPLVVLGNYRDDHPYHRQVKQAATDNVRFLGAIYAPEKVLALRKHAAIYLHGHQVGGTNPSLVEALGCGNPVLAHDNPFNRWVAGEDNFYFTADNCAEQLDYLLNRPETLQKSAASSHARFDSYFRWLPVLDAYRKLLEQCGNRNTKDIQQPTLWPPTLLSPNKKSQND